MKTMNHSIDYQKKLETTKKEFIEKGYNAFFIDLLVEEAQLLINQGKGNEVDFQQLKMRMSTPDLEKTEDERIEAIKKLIFIKFPILKSVKERQIKKIVNLLNTNAVTIDEVIDLGNCEIDVKFKLKVWIED